MSHFVLLDSGVVGMITNPKANPICQNCRLWLDNLEPRRYRIALPEIADMVQEMGYDAIVATTNVKHLSLFVDARDWQEI